MFPTEHTSIVLTEVNSMHLGRAVIFLRLISSVSPLTLLGQLILHQNWGKAYPWWARLAACCQYLIGCIIRRHARCCALSWLTSAAQRAPCMYNPPACPPKLYTCSSGCASKRRGKQLRPPRGQNYERVLKIRGGEKCAFCPHRRRVSFRESCVAWLDSVARAETI